mgnify:CR=1 FL=1
MLAYVSSFAENVAHQKDVIVRRTRFDLEKAQERQHILLGLHIALENIDAIVELLKKSRDRQDAIVKLMEGYGLSDKQAAAILDMRSAARRTRSKSAIGQNVPGRLYCIA